jgi:hypothetical protein
MDTVAVGSGVEVGTIKVGLGVEVAATVAGGISVTCGVDCPPHADKTIANKTVNIKYLFIFTPIFLKKRMIKEL